jgi:hypothetical protein
MSWGFTWIPRTLLLLVRPQFDRQQVSPDEYDRVAAWEELDCYPRRQALEWIRMIFVAYEVPRLDDEMVWWESQLRSADN